MIAFQHIGKQFLHSALSTVGRIGGNGGNPGHRKHGSEIAHVHTDGSGGMLESPAGKPPQRVTARPRLREHDVLPGHIRAKTSLAELDIRVFIFLRFDYFHGFRHSFDLTSLPQSRQT